MNSRRPNFGKSGYRTTNHEQRTKHHAPRTTNQAPGTKHEPQSPRPSIPTFQYSNPLVPQSPTPIPLPEIRLPSL